MKEQIKAPEKIKLRDEEIAIMLVIGMLTEMVECSCKTEGKVKAMESEIKENAQGTNSNRKETRNQIHGLDQKEEINL